jgi:hypothetical protein
MISFISITNKIQLMIYKQKKDISSIYIREIACYFREGVRFMEIIPDRLLIKFWKKLGIFKIYILLLNRNKLLIFF